MEIVLESDVFSVALDPYGVGYPLSKSETGVPRFKAKLM